MDTLRVLVYFFFSFLLKRICLHFSIAMPYFKFSNSPLWSTFSTQSNRLLLVVVGFFVCLIVQLTRTVWSLVVAISKENNYNKFMRNPYFENSSKALKKLVY